MPLQLGEITAANYERFVARVTKAGIVWGLKCPSGWANSPSHKASRQLVLLFWSDRAYANRCAKAEWASYVPTEIDLPSFLNTWLPGMAHDGHLAGVNWDAELCGVEVGPEALKAEIEGRLAPPS